MELRPSKIKIQFAPVVLLVDDDPDQLSIFKSLLKTRNYEVITAHSPSEALAVLKDVHVDIMVSDVYMPNTDGAHFISKARSLPGFNRLPVISFSAAEEGIESILERLGANRFCKKREASKNLFNQIEELLDGNAHQTSLLNRIQERFS